MVNQKRKRQESANPGKGSRAAAKWGAPVIFRPLEARQWAYTFNPSRGRCVSLSSKPAWRTAKRDPVSENKNSNETLESYRALGVRAGFASSGADECLSAYI